MTKVSVIIPNYNHSKYLSQRINSILDQTYRDYEIIILDDHSIDDSRTIIGDYLKLYPHIKAYFNSRNSGNPFKQWDFGVSKAEGEFIWIAESDDYAHPDFLKETVPVLEKNSNIGIVYCNSKVIDEENQTEYYSSEGKSYLYKSRWNYDYSNIGIKEIEDFLFLNNIINNVSGVLFRKKIYKEAGWADHSMRYCGDWFHYLRMLLISDIAYISKSYNFLRLHRSSSFHGYLKDAEYLNELLRIYSFVINRTKLSKMKRRAIAKKLLKILLKKVISGWIALFDVLRVANFIFKISFRFKL